MELENPVAQSENGPAVALQALRKSFGEQTVLNGIDLEVAHGETLAVLGRSGTGKSILLKLIIGLQPPDSGSIRVQGRDITKMSPDELNDVRQKIGFLFQEAALYDSLTLEENVGFPLSRRAHLSPAALKDRVHALLASVGVADQAAKMPAEISGGMKKRVGLARALALDPEILLFDEPTAGLDPITAGEIEELILKLQKERTTTAIVVTHDLHGARTISNRLALLHEGNILIEGTMQHLEESDEPLVASFLRRGT